MEKTLCVAKELYNMYRSRFGHNMDQLKMHKLMYFSNRESLMAYNDMLFDEDFKGWKYGPVLLNVRNEYTTNNLFKNVTGDVSENTRKLLEDVLERYGTMSSWKLSKLSHEEMSWQHARTGLNSDDNGNVSLNENMLRLDAKRELVARSQQ